MCKIRTLWSEESTRIQLAKGKTGYYIFKHRHNTFQYARICSDLEMLNTKSITHHLLK